MSARYTVYTEVRGQNLLTRHKMKFSGIKFVTRFLHPFSCSLTVNCISLHYGLDAISKPSPHSHDNIIMEKYEFPSLYFHLF